MRPAAAARGGPLLPALCRQSGSTWNGAIPGHTVNDDPELTRWQSTLFTVTVPYVQTVTYEVRAATAADAAEDYVLGDVVGEGDPEPMLPVGVVEGRVVYEGPFALPRVVRECA